MTIAGKITEQRMFKIAGIYLIIILALVRLMVYPLHGSVEKKRIIFNDLNEAYELKLKHFERQDRDQSRPVKIKMDKETLALYIYEKAMPISTIQVELLETIMKIADRKRLIFQNFEMLEPSPGKVISEIPVIIRLSGKPADLLDALRTILSDRKAKLVKTLEMSKSGNDFLLSLTINVFRVEK